MLVQVILNTVFTQFVGCQDEKVNAKVKLFSSILFYMKQRLFCPSNLSIHNIAVCSQHKKSTEHFYYYFDRKNFWTTPFLLLVRAISF